MNRTADARTRPRRRSAAVAGVMVALAWSVGVDIADPSSSLATAVDVVMLLSPVGSPGTEELPTPQPVPAPNGNYRVFTMGSVEIPRLKVREPLVFGVGNRSFDKGVGWWPGSALPGGYGNVVLGGHRTLRRKPFRHLERLKRGDQIIVTYRSTQYVYEVRGRQIVDDTDMHIIDQMPGRTITLFSCHPVGATDRRIVVTGELVRRVAGR